MGRWLKKFSERKRVSTDGVDTVPDLISGSIQNSTDSVDTLRNVNIVSVEPSTF